MANLGAARRGTGTAIAVIGLAALAAGCTSSPGGSNQPGGPEKTSIVVGAVPAADAAGLYLAQQRGFFAAAGLHVKIVNIVSAEDAIKTQVSGGFDVTLGNYVSYIEADAEQNAGLRIIAEGSVMQPANQELVTLPGSRITTLARLKGATLAVNVRNNIGTILIGSALEAIGLPLRDVKLVPIPFPHDDDRAQGSRGQRGVDARAVPEFRRAADRRGGDLRPGPGRDGGLPHRRLCRHPGLGAEIPPDGGRLHPRPGAGPGRGRLRPRRRRTGRGDIPGRVTADGRGHGGPQFPLGVDRARLQRVADAMQRFGLIQQTFNVSQMIG